MILFRLIVILLLLTSPELIACDFVNTLSKNTNVTAAGYYTSDANESAIDMYRKFKNGEFMPMPHKTKSFGFSDDEFWYALTIDNNKSVNSLVLSFLNPVADSVDLFVFENGRLIKEQKSGYLTPIEDRPVKTLAVSFRLDTHIGNATYLIKVVSDNPHYSGFRIGSFEEINSYWNTMYFIMSFTVGVYFILAIYNIFLYLNLKESINLYYIIYMTGLLAFNIAALGYLPIIFNNTVPVHIAIAISTQIEFIALSLFAVNFLRLSNKLKTVIFTALGVEFICATIFMFSMFKHLFVASIFILLFILIYVGFASYKSGFRSSIYYILGTSVNLVLFLIFMLMNQGLFFAFDVYILNICNSAMVWDLLMFSFAIFDRVNTMKNNKITTEKILVLKSRQESIGEVLGNIAHQWRAPLAAINYNLTSIRARLLYGDISKEEIADEIEKSEELILYLSQTTELFNGFAKNSNLQKTKFAISDAVQKSVNLVTSNYKTLDIAINLNILDDTDIIGEENALVQVLMIILQNAKDALIGTDINDKTINVGVERKNENIVISIQDNGGGIKIEPVEKVFEPFQTSKTDGIGAGLFIAKRLVEEKLDGSIKAYNYLDGAMFEICVKCINGRDGGA